MLPYTPRQPRNFCVQTQHATGHRTQPWNGVTPDLGPAFQSPINPVHQGLTTAMAETTAAPQPWRLAAAADRAYVSSGVNPMHVPKPASVKHLTCYFWAKNGVCKFSEEDCLYAHHNTGKVAQGPLQVEQGRRF